MEIILKKLDELIPYENNPRINDGAVKYVAASIKEFGWKVPMVIDENNVIVSGHTRFKAAQELGLTEAPCIIADDLTEEQIKAFRIADNKVAEIAEWNHEMLELELSELEELDFSMEDFGFTNIEETDVNLNDFFEEAEQKEKEPKKVQCPHCGEWLEV